MPSRADQLRAPVCALAVTLPSLLLLAILHHASDPSGVLRYPAWWVWAGCLGVSQLVLRPPPVMVSIGYCWGMLVTMVTVPLYAAACFRGEPFLGYVATLLFFGGLIASLLVYDRCRIALQE